MQNKMLFVSLLKISPIIDSTITQKTIRNKISTCLLIIGIVALLLPITARADISPNVAVVETNVDYKSESFDITISVPQPLQKTVYFKIIDVSVELPLPNGVTLDQKPFIEPTDKLPDTRTWKFMIGSDANPGTYELKFVVKYRWRLLMASGDGTEATTIAKTTMVIYPLVEEITGVHDNTKVNLDLLRDLLNLGLKDVVIDIPPTEENPNVGSFDISFTPRVDVTINNIYVDWKNTPSGKIFFHPNNPVGIGYEYDSKSCSKILKGDTKTCVFNFKISNGADPGEYDFNIIVEYEYGEEGIYRLPVDPGMFLHPLLEERLQDQPPKGFTSLKREFPKCAVCHKEKTIVTGYNLSLYGLIILITSLLIITTLALRKDRKQKCEK